MTDPDPAEIPQARVGTGRRHAWVWIVPLIAAAIVIGIGWRALLQRGPAITISFDAAQGIQSGQTKIRRKDVDLGTVESVLLTHDLSRVIVRARMLRTAAPYLNQHTQFWIVRPRVSAEGISGLATLVSGVYIEMSPGLGLPAREFTGLEEPPVLQQNRPGSFFTLHASQLSSLNQGSAISYRGLSVGEILGYTLNQQNQKVDIYAFIRAPYDRLVHLQTRFWNASGLDVSLGAQGIRLAASSWQQLISGGVEFSTPSAEMNSPPAPKGTQFRLYDDKSKAEEDPRGTALMYQVDFMGAVHGIQRGTAVELLGTQIGQVASIQLEYDDATHILHTPVLLAIDPARVKIVNRSPPRSPAEADLEFSALMEQWVEHGLRARLSAASLLTGQQIVSLDMVPGVPKARIKFIGAQMQLPTAPSLDIAEILRSVHSILEHIDSATAGPELKHAVKSLDQTLTHMEHITSEVEPDIKPLIRSLRQTADAAQRTMQQAGNALGSNAPQGTDLPRLMQELTEAARSVRALADYLDQHPEALIRGRKQEDDK